jgi:hypothetical protein
MKVEFRGLDVLVSYFREFPELSAVAARLAINASSRHAARLASKHIRAQVAFSRSYLGAAGAPDSKIRIRKFARGGDLEAIISARDRPTSLARFATGTPHFGRRPKGAQAPRVRVKTGGRSVQLKRGFYLRLKRGPILTEDAFNIGLAVRLKKGEELQASMKASPLGGGAYLLYGPSVAQVFDTVRDDIAPEVADYAAQEFLRQFRRASRG